jgi:hypothetical protein
MRQDARVSDAGALSPAAADLRKWALAWSRRYWDDDEHLVLNPPGSMNAEGARDRSIHLVPNSAWIAYGLLGERNGRDRAEGVRAIERLLELQYDEPGTPYHGTFARFLEAPHPPDHARIWVHYDPNWRQFVGTTFALVLEDLDDRVNADLQRRIEASIGLAVTGEPDGRIAPTYSNPALMRAWLDAWYGVRTNTVSLVGRGESFARTVVAEHDRHDAFEEYNSPTYYGIDLYALRLWTLFPPTEYFARAGERLAAQLWAQAARFYNAWLANFCGPYTRSYHPDSTRSVALFSLWIWATFGPEHAPLPDLEATSIDHCHDLMAGPVVARLAPEAEEVESRAFVEFTGERDVTQDLAGRRRITAHVERDLMLGAEASDHDWKGWVQFLPVTAHWAEPGDTIGVLWLRDPHVVRAHVDGRTVHVETGRTELTFTVLARRAAAGGSSVHTGAMRIHFDGATAVLATPKELGTHELTVSMPNPDTPLKLRFEPSS